MELVQRPREMTYKGIEANLTAVKTPIIKENTPRGEDKDKEGSDEEIDAKRFKGDLFTKKGLNTIPSRLPWSPETELGPESASTERGGVYNKDTNTIDATNISIWEVGGTEMRYNRIYSQLVPHPPMPSDKKCYLSHTGDAVYWLAQEHDKN
jgi:hypothetical protein